MENRSKSAYTVSLFYYGNGIWGARGDDIKGLVLEGESLDEIRRELIRIAPQLLRSNHGLTDAEIEKVSLYVEYRESPEFARTKQGRLFQLYWEDTPQLDVSYAL